MLSCLKPYNTLTLYTPEKTEAQVLAEVWTDVRKLTWFYLAKARHLPADAALNTGDTSLNSLRWLIAHLVWAEDFLLIRGLGRPGMPFKWLNQFEIGSDPANVQYYPDDTEVWEALEKTHETALGIVRAQTTEELAGPNAHDMTFGGENSRRSIIRHAIRHEPMHTGQISWIMKVNGVKML